ncbi:MAG: hypothetical protein J5I98_14535 [Phaeodactylibacter sp.]|nr:hypothetical protein [Phaeodactylibacter sp.]
MRISVFLISRNKAVFKSGDVIDITQDIIDNTGSDKQKLIDGLKNDFRLTLNKMNEASELYSVDSFFDDGEYVNMEASKIGNVQLILENMKKRKLLQQKH